MPDSCLPALIIEPSREHRSSVIWLHGLGADGHDFAPIVEELNLPGELGVRFILPHAPKRPVTINGGYVMPAWYDISTSDLGRLPDAGGILETRQAVERLIDRELAAGIPPGRIIMAGFSQGGVISLEMAAHHQDKIGGAILLSCYSALTGELPQTERPIPIFMGHGSQDTIVPMPLGLAACARLEELGYPVEWRQYSMPHSVCMEEINDIRRWLVGRLGE